MFAYWVALDRDNCELVRAGLLRFRRPESYVTNKVAKTSIQAGLAFADNKILNRGLNRLAEVIECIGGQLHIRIVTTKRLALRPQYCWTRGDHFWDPRVPGLLHQHVVWPLKAAHGNGYVYSGLDEVEKSIASLPLVKKYLAKP